ncbi:uncharacterized protein LOC130786489 [Actinidia eriantha]|uniref:uncharacterized protein LOC130786489 n=1 Tax=Actinidia eriantha TaxID=165200 RepID=UPI002585E4A6|nr:uncharacterized protein LOC130786489 [Actinidia eriantha]
MNKMSAELIRKTMKVYIDDMLVKSLKAANHIAHLEEAFGVLRKYRMMLNPSKCIFGVSLVKFLRFLVTKREIKANPDQIQALITMGSSKNIREVQQLIGQVAALNRFVSKSADKFQGDYLTKDTRTVAYLDEVNIMSGKIRNFKIRQIPRKENKEADALANLTLAFDFSSDRCIPLEFLASLNIEVANSVFRAEEGPTWMDEIFIYLRDGTLSQDKLQAHHI